MSLNDATKAIFLLGVLLLLVPAFAAQKDTNSAPTFSARTELVMIPAVINDHTGAPIRGLKKEDFAIFENNKERSITVFEEVVTDTTRVARASEKNPQGPQGKDGPYTNMLVGNDSPRRVTAIVLDFINTAFTDQARGRQQLLKYLSAALDSHEPTALFVITPSGVRVITDFTTDPAILAKAMRQLHPNPDVVVVQDSGAAPEKIPGSFYKNDDEGAVSEAKQHMTQAINEVEQHFTGFQTRVAATLTLEAMQQIAHALEGVPGRKSLIWASGGFPFAIADNNNMTKFWYANDSSAYYLDKMNIRESATGMLPLYAATWRALNQAQVSVYPIDIRGLVNEQYVDPSIQHPGRDYVAQKSWQQNETLATFNNFAEMTGGKAYYNTNDLEQGFREAAADSTHYYLIGYYRSKEDRELGWHKLEVRVKRSEAKVRARSGFLVTKSTTDLAKVEETDIQSALLSPIDFTAIPFRMQWTTRTPDAAKVKVGYEISIPASIVNIDEQDTNHLRLEIVAAAKSLDGKLAGKPFKQSLEAHLTREMTEKIKSQGIEYSGEVELPPGDYVVRLLVRDQLTGRMGTLAAPLNIAEKAR